MAPDPFVEPLPKRKRIPRSDFPICHPAPPILCHTWDRDCCATQASVYGCYFSVSFDKGLAHTRRSLCGAPVESTCTWEIGRRGYPIPLTARGLSRLKAHAVERDSFSLRISCGAWCFFFSFLYQSSGCFLFIFIFFYFTFTVCFLRICSLLSLLLCLVSCLLCLYGSLGRSLVRTLIRHFVSTGMPCPLLSDVHLGNDNKQLMTGIQMTKLQ